MDRKEWLKWIWYGACLIFGSWLGSRALGGWHWSSDAAAWVQAIGSIAAIAAAIWIGRESDHRARELVVDERNRQARIAAHSVANRLENISDEASLKANVIEILANHALVYADGVFDPKDEHFLFIETPVSDLYEGVLLFDEHNGYIAREILDYVESHNIRAKIYLRTTPPHQLSRDHLLKVYEDTISRFRKISGEATKARSALTDTFRLLPTQDERTAS